MQVAAQEGASFGAAGKSGSRSSAMFSLAEEPRILNRSTAL